MMLERRNVVAQLLANRSDKLLVITSLGTPTWDVSSIGDSPMNFYVNGVMGSASMVALGLALAQPNYRVLLLAGDGELVMQLGSLATIGVANPSNLSVVVLDNERYGETGAQLSHSARGLDIAGVAKSCAISDSVTIRTQAELDAATPGLTGGTGLRAAVIKISPVMPQMIMPPSLDPAYLKHRMRERLTGRV